MVLKARTGECTPPGVTAAARENVQNQAAYAQAEATRQQWAQWQQQYNVNALVRGA